MTSPYVAYLVSEVRASNLCGEHKESVGRLKEITQIFRILLVGMKSVGPEQMQELIHSIFSEDQWFQMTLSLPLVWDQHFNQFGLLMLFPPTMSLDILEYDLDKDWTLFSRSNFQLAGMSLEDLRGFEVNRGWRGMLLRAWIHYREHGPVHIPLEATLK